MELTLIRQRAKLDETYSAMTKIKKVLIQKPLFLIFNLCDSTVQTYCPSIAHPYFIDQQSGFLPDAIHNSFYCAALPDIQSLQAATGTKQVNIPLSIANCTIRDNDLQFKHLKFFKPDWFNRTEIGINYSNGEFLKAGNNYFYIMHSYPFAMNLATQAQYEIPQEVLYALEDATNNDIRKSTKPTFSTVGIIESNNRYILVFESIKSRILYTAEFLMTGDFVSCETKSRLGNNLALTNGKNIFLYGKTGHSNGYLLKCISN